MSREFNHNRGKTPVKYIYVNVKRDQLQEKVDKLDDMKRHITQKDLVMIDMKG